MASRKEQKEAARTRRLEEERARAAKARQQRRTRMLGGIVLAAVAVVAVAIAVSGGGSSSSAATGLETGSKAKTLASQVGGLLAGIPQSGATLGSPSAPVTMTYYGDLQCPVCRDFTLSGGFQPLVANEVRSGKVQIVYRAYKTATPDQSTFDKQQTAALAAGKQNHFWDYTELFYHQQGTEGTGYVTESYLEGIARQIAGLNVAGWRGSRNDSTLAAQVIADATSGGAAGVQGTPTLIFKGPKGQQIAPSGVPSYSDLQRAIKSVR